jgi:hypothetical protein
MTLAIPNAIVVSFVIPYGSLILPRRRTVRRYPTDSLYTNRQLAVLNVMLLGQRAPFDKVFS